MNDKILGIILILVGILLVIWYFFVPMYITQIVIWIVVALLIIVGIFLLLRKGY